MRPIDADELKKTLLEYNYTTEHNQIFRYIDEQPTVYDVDKIVKEINEWSFNANIDVGDGTVMNHNLIVRDTAIEIVKAGATNES